ncbi:MAG: hypothetical protein ACQES7_04285 [Pseudomonadota bacterium]
MANALGIDLGQVYQTAEAVKGMQMNRQDREAARERGQAVNALRGRAVGEGGKINKEAMGEFVAFAPEEAKQLMDAIGSMDEREREAMQERVDTLGRVAAYIRSSDNPEQAYQTAKQNLNPEVAGNMPEQYDPNFVEMGLARAREIDDMLANPQLVTVGAEDRLYKDGQVLERTTSSAERGRQTSRANALTSAATSRANALTRAEGDSGPQRLKSADTNAIYRQAAGIFGGTFDPTTGRVSGLDPSQSAKVQSVSERASEVYANGDSNTHAGAVARAARELGVEVERLGDNGNAPSGGGNLDRNQLLDMYAD